MLRWVICSSLIGLAAPAVGIAQERLTQEEALRLVFPAPARIERHTAYLRPADVDAASRMAGDDGSIDQRIVTYYVGTDGKVPLGVAYFDVHRVRTRSEIAMVVVDPDGAVRQVEILRFDEPPEYRAPRRWLDQLRANRLTADLSLKGEVANLTGATLTSRALVRATRRVLALHRVINPLGTAR